MQVILASKSPRRLQLLQAAGLAVEVRPAHANEALLPGEDARTSVLRLAEVKAATIANPQYPVIAADTLVSLNDNPMGQPADMSEARKMLRSLAGSSHQVHTGVCVRFGNRLLIDCACTHVHFFDLQDEEIETYLDHNEVLDKAGAYEIQGGAASFVRSVDGPLDNVIGLPVRLTLSMLKQVTAQ
ncbi:MAG: Maf family protein [Mariprofundaceae bacterium]|nr:Maf family protein [Mariprofundaceae bacterium]